MFEEDVNKSILSKCRAANSDDSNESIKSKLLGSRQELSNVIHSRNQAVFDHSHAH